MFVSLDLFAKPTNCMIFIGSYKIYQNYLRLTENKKKYITWYAALKLCAAAKVAALANFLFEHIKAWHSRMSFGPDAINANIWLWAASAEQ